MKTVTVLMCFGLLAPTLWAQPIDWEGHGHPQPLAAWSFDTINGDVVPDVSGHGFDAVLHGGATAIADPRGGQALEFDGTGNDLAWAGQPQQNGLSIEKRLTGSFQELSIEAWIRKEPGPWMSIVYRDFWDYPSGFGLVAEWQAGNIVFGHYDQSGHASYATTKTAVQDGTWHHVVGTMQPKDQRYLYRIYVDGKLDAEQLGEWGIEPAAENEGILKIAYPNKSGADHPYLGALDGIAIYGQCLTPGQVAYRYQATRERRGSN